MAGKRLEYEIEVEASDAISDFKKVGKEAEKAGKAIKKGLEVKPDTGKIDKFIANLEEAADEAKNVAKAVQSVKKFAPEVDDSEIAGMVLALRKAGVEFDALEVKAEDLGTTLKEIDGARIKDVDSGMRTAAGGADQLTRSVGGSKSVLANMVGNATQDLGVLTGVAGSAGVALGQMGEYMADARLEGEGMGSVIKNFAGIAGPVAALSLGIGVATKLFGDFKQRQQEVARQTGETADALIEIAGIVEQINEELSAQADVGDFGDKLISSLTLTDEKINTVLASANRLGIEFTDVGDIIAGFGEKGDIEGFNLLVESIMTNLHLTKEEATGVANVIGTAGSNFGLITTELVGTTDLTKDWAEANKDVLLAYAAIGQAAKDTDINEAAKRYLTTLELTDEGLQRIADARDRLAAQGIIDPSEIQIASELNREVTTVTRSMEDINAALANQRTQTGLTAAAWTDLLFDLKDGNIDTERAVGLWDLLQKQLGLTDAEMDELAQQKLDEYLLEIAEAEKEAEAEALRLQEAIADLGDTIGEIDTDDLANISGALEEALTIGGVGVDLQVEEAQLRGEIDETVKEIQEFADEHARDGPIDWAVVLDPAASAKGYDAELAGFIGSLQDQFQTGIVNAFQSGGADAATGFVNEFMPTLTALGMTEAQAREFMGIPADGNIPMFLQLQIDAEAKADALAILDSIAGVDPNNPKIAYISLAVQTDQIPAEIGEIAAQILAGEALGVPAKLEGVSQADIDAALAFLAGYGITVTVTPDTTPVVDGVAAVKDEVTKDELPVTMKTNADETKEEIEDATEDQTTQVFVPKSPSLGQMQTLIDHVARARTVALTTTADNAGAIDGILDGVAADRDAEIWVRLPNYNQAERDLQLLARRRDANIYVHTIPTGGASAGTTGTVGGDTLMAPAPAAAPLAAGREGGGGAGVATLAAPPAPSVTMHAAPAAAPVTRNVTVNVNAAVIGNRFDVQRAVARALAGAQRLGAAV